MRSAGDGAASRLTRSAGHACITLLSLLRSIPAGLSGNLILPLLPLYSRLRSAHAARLRACFAASPFQGQLDLDRYYAQRARLLLRSLAMHGRPHAAPIRIAGEPHYLGALETGRPIALLGLHAGPWEELHRIPPAAPGRPFCILTAPAFSPPLTAFMAAGREREGKEVLWIGERGPRGLEAGVRKVVASRGILALMADQHPGPAGTCEYLDLWDSVRVPWPARLIRFLADRDFLFLPVSASLAPDGGTDFVYHAPMDRPGPDSIRGFLESAIARAPLQWNWSYPKAVPKGWRPIRAGKKKRDGATAPSP